MHAYGIRDANFTASVLGCLPTLPLNVDRELKKDPNRKDFRNLNVFSIDPPGCVDIDDAIHVKLLKNGNYQLGVHIADVTHFIEPGKKLIKL